MKMLHFVPLILASGTWLSALSPAPLDSGRLSGPPMVCHEILIGDARTINTARSPGETAGRRDLIREVLDLLAPETDPLVRMETLRRAVVVGTNEPHMLMELLSALQARVLDAESRDRLDALAWFDAGYLAAAWWQSDRERAPEVGLAEGCVGYAWIRKALADPKHAPAMEFAAALVTHPALHKGTHETYRSHLERAAVRAAPGSLLEKNLMEHCRNWSESYEGLKANGGAARETGGPR